MSRTIAITGKGGVGKTTVAGLVVARLIARGNTPVLAVDADPNTCLDEALGVRVLKSVGRVREDARELTRSLDAGIPKQDLLELKIAESLVEAEDFDLIAMGRSEGPGCYCYANNVLKQVLGQISDAYPYVVLDNEAGLENLSRRIVRKVDMLVLVADPSRRGLQTVRRLHGLAQEMEVRYGRLVIVVNRLRGGDPPAAAQALADELRAHLLLGLPDDEPLARAAERGQSLLDLPPINPVVAGIDALVASFLA